MPQKEIRIFDTSNKPLQVRGIRFELFDVATGTLLDSQQSDDLNPGLGGPSNQWGVRLNFSPSNNPLDVYTTDPTYQYPGNTLRYLEGQLQDRIDIDLLKVPSSSGGQPMPLTSTEPWTVLKWLREGKRWSHEEKTAVWNLISNYASVFVPWVDAISNLPDLSAVAQNWQKTMSRLGIADDLFVRGPLVR